MAWIKEVPRKNGITYRVTWTEPGDTKESTLSIRDDKDKAELNVRLLNANNQSFRAAKLAADRAQIEGPTLRQFMVEHIDQLTDPSAGTINKYRKAIPLYFDGPLGSMPVEAITHQDIKAWIKYMQGKRKKNGDPLSAKTISNQHGLLSATMNTAMRTPRLNVTTNPCKGITLPKDKRTEEIMRFMTAAESMAIVDIIRPRAYAPFVALLRGTGLRFNEAAALRPTDFNLNAEPPTLRVERAWNNDGTGKFTIGPPKTKKSRRTVSLPPSLVTMIRPLVESAAPLQSVFRTSTGSPIRHSTFFKYWKRALDDLGHPEGAGNRPRIHDLRHTHASLMLSAGMNIYELSRRLGHESIKVTVDRYSDLVPDAHFRGAAIAETALAVEAPVIVAEIVDDEKTA